MLPKRLKSGLLPLLIGGLVLLLPLLAALQYHWLGQLSQAEREHLQAHLHADAEHFSEDFDREMLRAAFTFQVAPPPAGTPLGAALQREYLGGWQRWETSAPYPKLVRAVYILDVSGARPQVWRAERGERAFVPAPWPVELERWRDQFDGREAASDVEQLRRVDFMPLPDTATPMLVLPVFRIPHAIDVQHLRQQIVRVTLPAPSAFGVVVFDLDYMRQKFLPALANRYFSADHGESDYQLAIVRRGSSNSVIYSNGNEGADFAPDISIDLLRLRGMRFNEHFAGSAAGRHGPPPPPTPESAGGGFAPQPQRADAGGALPNSSRLGVYQPRIGGLFLLGRPPEARMMLGMLAGRWQLHLAHRAGSLDAAVAQVRRRNLFVSFGILLLLALNVGIIVQLTRRAQRLAARQMEFVAGISHELHTPLAVIRSAADNLADGLIEDRAQVRQYGVAIRREGGRLAEMVEQVLEYAGLNSGRRNYELGVVNVVELVERALSTCQPLIEQGGVTVERVLPADLPPVLADPAALQHALQNLISNAVKYGGPARWLRLAATVGPALPVQDVAEAGCGSIHVTVEDRGPGIAAADLPHLFEPFFRGRAVLASQIPGTGLGLCLVQHIVEAHGGRVTVASEPGQGSRFTLCLPALAADLAPAVRPATQVPV